jgi:transposase
MMSEPTHFEDCPSCGGKPKKRKDGMQECLACGVLFH